MDFKNLFKKNDSQARFKKLPKTLSEEVANVKTCQEAYYLAKRMLNPDEILRATGKTIKVFRKLEHEGQVSACITSRNAGVTSMDWRLNFEDLAHKDFYEGLFNEMDIDRIIKSILKAPLYGYQPIEIIWGIKDGYVVPVDITAKPQEWFDFSYDGELLFLEKGNYDGVPYPKESKKFLCPKNDEEYLNPYGKSVLSRCFWDVIFKKGSKELWMKFAERFGMPTVVAKYQEGMSDKEVDGLLDMLENLIQDAVAAIPDNNTVEYLDASSRQSSSGVYKELIDECDKSISKNILGQTLTTDSGNTGSYALGQVHQQVRQDIVDSDARLCESQFNILLRWIHELNFSDGVAPTFEFFTQKEGDKTVAERDKILADTGVKFTKNYYIKTYGLEDDDFTVGEDANTDKEEETKTEEQPEKNNPEDDGQDKAPDTKDFAEAERVLNAKQLAQSPEAEKYKTVFDIVDKITNSLSDEDLNALIEPRLRTVIQTFSETRDIDEVEKELDKLYPEKDAAGLEEMLAKALFISDLISKG